MIRLVALAALAIGCVAPAVECPRTGPVQRVVVAAPRFVGMEAPEARRLLGLLRAELRRADIAVREPSGPEGEVPCRERSCAPLLARAAYADAALLVRVARRAPSPGLEVEVSAVDATGRLIARGRFPIEQATVHAASQIVDQLLARSRVPHRVPPPPSAPPRYDRWYALQANAALQLGGAGSSAAGIAYLGWARGSLDPDRARPATENSPFWGVGLELMSTSCSDDDDCPGRTSLGPAVRAGIAWVRLPGSYGHIYLQAGASLTHDHDASSRVQGAAARGAMGVSLLPAFAAAGPVDPEAIILVLFSHLEVSFEAYRPSRGPVETGLGFAFGLGF